MAGRPAQRGIDEPGQSVYGNYPVAHDDDFNTIVLADQYTFGDVCWYLWRKGEGERRLLFGTPLSDRSAEDVVAPNGLGAAVMVGDDGLLFISSLFSDHYGLTWLSFDHPDEARPVRVDGTVHRGAGEMDNLKRVLPTATR